MSAILRLILPRSARRSLRDWRFNRRYGSRDSFSVTIDGRTTHFLCPTTDARRWFYPRLEAGRFGNPDGPDRAGGLHEEPVTRLFLSHCRKARCFFDIGANMGWFTCLAGTHMPQPDNVAFELDADTHALLHANVHANGLCDHDHGHAEAGKHDHREHDHGEHDHGEHDHREHDDGEHDDGEHDDGHGHVSPRGRVVTVHAAVTDRPGEITYERPTSRESHPGFSIVPGPVLDAAEATEKLSVPAVSIDAYCAEHGCRPDLVKIDVEGAEHRVLTGMSDTLDNCRPTILMEVHEASLLAQGLSPKAVFSLLIDRGYTIHIVHGHRNAADRGPQEPRLAALDPDATLGENVFVQAAPPA